MTNLNYRLEASQNAAIEVVASEAQDIATIAADYQRATGHRRASLHETITARLDGLLDTLLGAFSGSVSADEVPSILGEHHPLTETRLAKLPQHIVPLVVMRELISVHMIPVDRARLMNWNSFSERYRAGFMAC